MMRPLVSYANRPARLSILSDDAIDRAGAGLPSNFNYPLQENILDAKAIQLMSARIPNVFPPIPPYQRIFGYKLVNALGVVTAIKFFQIQHNSLLPDLIYANYAAVATQLNIDAGFTVTYTGTLLTKADLLAAPPSAADMTFAMNTGTQRLVLTNVNALNNIVLLTEQEITQYFVPNTFVKNYLTLNFLLGFETRFPTIAPILGTLEATSYIDLLRTSAIYIMSNLTLNGTLLSNGARNLLQMIAVQQPFLTVIDYLASTGQYTEAVPQTIGTISLYLLDDNLQPLDLPENAQTLFEIGFLYDDSRG
jgi:hypothetical protein